MILVLETGLFNDADVVRAALDTVKQTTSIQELQLNCSTMNDTDWDDMLDRVLSADKVITL